jgi:hypothetical protein
MVPLGAVADVRESVGPVQITRYSMFPAARVIGVFGARREHRGRPGDDGTHEGIASCPTA